MRSAFGVNVIKLLSLVIFGEKNFLQALNLWVSHGALNYCRAPSCALPRLAIDIFKILKVLPRDKHCSLIVWSVSDNAKKLNEEAIIIGER
jgi:hypothetical protein